MADETVVNGVSSDDHHVVDERETEDDTILKRDRDLDLRKDGEISELNRKIEGLEQEKSGLIRENEVKNEKIKVLNDEIEGFKKKEREMKARVEEMQKEIDRSVEDKKALEAISARAADLETEVSRLQHDLISSMSENEENAAEFQKVKSEFEVYKQRIREKEAIIENLEKEKVSLQEKIDQIVHEVKKSKEENDIRSRDLVDKDVKFAEKESEILGLRMMKKITETEKSSLEEALKLSEERFKEMEAKVQLLEIELDLSQKLIIELKDKNSKLIDDAEKENNCSKLQWPAAALASTGTVAAAAAVCYLTYARRR